MSINLRAAADVLDRGREGGNDDRTTEQNARGKEEKKTGGSCGYWREREREIDTRRERKRGEKEYLRPGFPSFPPFCYYVYYIAAAF